MISKFKIYSILIFATLVNSCTIYVKNYQQNKPFVYATNIKLETNIKKDTQALILTGLQNQLDDSLQVKTIRHLFGKGINRPLLNKPPVYDSLNAERSRWYMSNYLHALGYFRDTIKYDTAVKKTPTGELRTTINFHVNPGPLFILDSVEYNFNKPVPEFQKLALQDIDLSFAKKNDAFSKFNIAAERDRLTDLFRNNGYGKFGNDMIVCIWDTLNTLLLNPNLDPFEQIALLDSIKRSKISPKTNIELRLRPITDSSRIKKYTVGNVTISPDVRPEYNISDTSKYFYEGDSSRLFIYKRNLFKSKILSQYIYLNKNEIFKQSNYTKTINKLNSFGSWSLVNIEPNWRKKTDTVDFKILLTPAKRYTVNYGFEGNESNTALSGNLFGLAATFQIVNRNVFRGLNVGNTNFRYGVETGHDKSTGVKFIQSREISFGYSITFPRAIPNIYNFQTRGIENFRSIVSINASNTLQRKLFEWSNLNASWGYEFQFNRKKIENKTVFIALRFPNIEFSLLDKSLLFDNLISQYPYLKYSFTDGLIFSPTFTVAFNGGTIKRRNVFRTSTELAGFPLSAIKNNSFLDTNLYRFIKMEVEFSRIIHYTPLHSFVFRFYGGIGYEFNSTINPLHRFDLPFFKQFYAGGPSSMRGWALRRLGPGSTINDFSKLSNQFADMQLETNAEYRFHLFNIGLLKFNSAFFVDAGNIWMVKTNSNNNRPNSIFNLNRLSDDIAIDIGSGLRIDMDFFILRFDFGYKIKDPSPDITDLKYQNKIMAYPLLKGTHFQLGINYPFLN